MLVNDNKTIGRGIVHLVGILLVGLLLAGVGVAAQEQAGTGHNRKAQELFDQAKSLLEEYKRSEALAALEEAIRIEPSWGELYFQLGEVYIRQFQITDDPALAAKATGALQQAKELDLSLAGKVFNQLAWLDFIRERYQDAIANYERARKADSIAPGAYSGKWRAMLRLPEFEQEIPKIRAEIESLLAHGATEPGGVPVSRDLALQAAMSGYRLLGDDDSRKKTEGLLVAEFPDSKEAASILTTRAFGEEDQERQAAMLEDLLARFPDHPDYLLWHSTLFRYRASQPDEPSDRLIQSGEERVRLATSSPVDKLSARLAVSGVFAHRRIALERAQTLADEAVAIASGLTPDSLIMGDKEDAKRDKERWAALLPGLREGVLSLQQGAHTVRGFVLLRRGKFDQAAGEFTNALQPVIEEVEEKGISRHGLLSARPRGIPASMWTPLFWLAEVFEAQKDYERASKFLLAGWYQGDEAARRYIRVRLPAVYRELGYEPAEADRALAEADDRFRSTEAILKEEEKEKLLADRVGEPAPEFEFVTLDRQPIRVSELKGKVVVLNFWATWCGPCIAEMPYLQTVVDSYKDNPEVAFFAVSVDDNRAPVRPFIEKNEYTMTVVYGSEAAKKYKIYGIPKTALIDRNGVIQYFESGFGGSGEEWIDGLTLRVEELLAIPPPPDLPPN